MEMCRSVVVPGFGVERLYDVGRQSHLPRRDRLINTGWLQVDAEGSVLYCLPDLGLIGGKDAAKSLSDLLRREQKQGIYPPSLEVDMAWMAIGVDRKKEIRRRRSPGDIDALIGVAKDMVLAIARMDARQACIVAADAKIILAGLTGEVIASPVDWSRIEEVRA